MKKRPFTTRHLCVPSFLCGLIALSSLLSGNVHAEEHTNSIGQRFALIPAGEFLMGSPKDYADAMAAKVTYDWYRNSPPSETPQRRVKISRPLRVAIHEVTLGEFRQFVTASGYVTDAERDGKGAAGKREIGRAHV